MVRGFGIFLCVCLISGVGVWRLVRIEAPKPPRALRAPTGISQSSVKDTAIRSQDWLSPGSDQIWVTALVGEREGRESAILVDLASGDSLCRVEGAAPVAWLSSTQALFLKGANNDPLWRKLLRQLGVMIARSHLTRLYRLDLVTLKFYTLAEIQTEVPATFLSVSPNRGSLVGAWGPRTCHEVDLKTGAVSEKVKEVYVWSPSFVDDETYLFVGETAIQSRRLGAPRSDRVSQPLLKEIRDAILERGTPSLRPCGRVGERILAVDQQVGAAGSRLLQLDERTSIVEELARLKPSREPPRFNSAGTACVYQGHVFEGNMDSVFVQNVDRGSEPRLLARGKYGDIHESTPLFLGEDVVLYVHSGIELMSIHLSGGEPHLHWPLALSP